VRTIIKSRAGHFLIPFKNYIEEHQLVTSDSFYLFNTMLVHNVVFGEILTEARSVRTPTLESKMLLIHANLGARKRNQDI
jgi:hypothetical protein